MLVDAWLPRAAARHPDRPALNRLTYAQLLGEAAAVARRLAARGVSAGDRVGLELPPGEAFCVALHGILLLGAVAVPIDVRLGPEERLSLRLDQSIRRITQLSSMEPEPLFLRAAEDSGVYTAAPSRTRIKTPRRKGRNR